MGRFQQSDTIAAVATAAGEGGIGIVRVSGPGALAIGDRIFRGRGGRPLSASPPFRLTLGVAVAPSSGEAIDEVLAVHMPPGNSYTGEGTVEVQAHGGPAVLDAILGEAFAAGARGALPGEFTKRAFLNGRIDLAQAEAVAELIAARSAMERRRALRLLRSGTGERIRALRRELVDLIAHGEAVIDFAEEEGVAEAFPAARTGDIAAALRELLEEGRAEACGHEGSRVVFAGPPNSGKSSLFNVLSSSSRSIVTPEPGTTRDYVEERVLLGGIRVTLIDTAGIREARDPAEAEGVRRSLERTREAELLLLVVDGSLPVAPGARALFHEREDRPMRVVVTKADLPRGLDPGDLASLAGAAPVHRVSSLTGEGCGDLARAIAEHCRPGEGGQDGRGTPLNARHRGNLALAVAHLGRALGRVGGTALTLDQLLLELHSAVGALGEITGESAGAEVLDRIFSRFCIGK